MRHLASWAVGAFAFAATALSACSNACCPSYGRSSYAYAPAYASPCEGCVPPASRATAAPTVYTAPMPTPSQVPPSDAPPAPVEPAPLEPSPDAPAPNDPAAAGQVPPGGGEQPAANVVEIRGHAFVPESITIRRGESVRWINRDAEAHTATRHEAPAFDLRIGPGEERSFTFDRTSPPDGFEYLCSVHGRMRHGRVIVLDR